MLQFDVWCQSIFLCVEGETGDWRANRYLYELVQNSKSHSGKRPIGSDNLVKYEKVDCWIFVVYSTINTCMFIKKFIIRIFVSNVSSQIKKMFKACKTGIIEKAIRYRKHWLRQYRQVSHSGPVYWTTKLCFS